MYPSLFSCALHLLTHVILTAVGEVLLVSPFHRRVARGMDRLNSLRLQR